MCGRYTYYGSEDILKEFNLLGQDKIQTKLALDIRDNYNVSPGSEMPVIVRGEQAHQIEFMIWGLIPSWSKEPNKSLKLINAREETLSEKPMWKRLIKSKRCIIPARGFYEWQKRSDGKKYPYYIKPMRGEVFSFAGLYDHWMDDQGTEMLTYTIITTKPNSEMKSIHDRMPAILNKQQMDLWLQPIDLSQDQLDDILGKMPDDILDIHEVSRKVNYTGNNSEDLIYPLDE